MSENPGYYAVTKNPRNGKFFAPKGDEAMELLSVRVPASFMDLLKKEAKKNNISKSELLREILSDRYGN